MIEFTSQLTWSFLRAISNFKSASQGPETRSFDFTPEGQEAYLAEITLAGSATQTIDLWSFTSLLSEATGLQSVEGIMLLVEATAEDAANCSVDLEYGSSNPMVWFFASKVTVPLGQLTHFTPTPYTVSNTQKTIKLTNTGTDSVTVFVGIPGDKKP